MSDEQTNDWYADHAGPIRRPFAYSVFLFAYLAIRPTNRRFTGVCVPYFQRLSNGTAKQCLKKNRLTNFFIMEENKILYSYSNAMAVRIGCCRQTVNSLFGRRGYISGCVCLLLEENRINMIIIHPLST